MATFVVKTDENRNLVSIEELTECHLCGYFSDETFDACIRNGWNVPSKFPVNRHGFCDLATRRKSASCRKGR